MYESRFEFMSIFGPIFFITIFIAIFIIIIIIIYSGLKIWRYNNLQPVLDVDVKVITKRTKLSDGIANFDGYRSSCDTNYYITFEVESGSRMEFMVCGDEYGMLIEGDIGKLTFQGTRYIGFERNSYSNRLYK
jgi:hypothetical protein